MRSLADAKTAIAALAARRFEPGISDRIRAAARRNPNGNLKAALDEHFGSKP